MLTKAIFHLVDFEEFHIKTKPVSIAAIHNNIWCAQENEITAWTLGKKKDIITLKLVKNV